MILEPKLGELAKKYSWSESEFALEEIVMHAKAAWVPKKYANWDELIAAAVEKALEKSPADVADWHYGSWHTLAMEHPLVKVAPFLNGFAGTGAQPLPGDKTTVKQAYKGAGPSQRFTMDWSNVDGSTENITLGESGNPYSAYFKDQWKDWADGRTFAMPFSDAAVNAQTTHTLRLLP
jgi:penicillin amidase